MVTSPCSANSSLRSLDRTSAVSIPTASRRSSVSVRSAPRGTAMVSSAGTPLPRESLVDALDLERPADRGERTAEAPEQLVVAAAPAQRDAELGVEDLEDRARVVAEVAQQPEVEDHAVLHLPGQ